VQCACREGPPTRFSDWLVSVIDLVVTRVSVYSNESIFDYLSGLFFTLSKIINATLLFLPHLSLAELKDLRPCPDRDVFNCIHTNCVSYWHFVLMDLAFWDTETAIF